MHISFIAVTRRLGYPLILLAMGVTLITGCSATGGNNVPSDFLLLVDAESNADKGGTQHANIRINAKGEAEYNIYTTGGAVHYDLNNVVTFTPEQVVESGGFELSDFEMGQLWNMVNENHFFSLTDDYRMALGSSYAFILIEADGRRHMVDNIGMEVPEIRVIIEAVNAFLPENVSLKYGKGFAP